MIKKFDGLGLPKIMRLQQKKRARLINNQCLAKKTLEGMGFSLKKKLKKLKKKIKKIPGVQMASALAKGKIKEAIAAPMSTINKVSAIPIIGPAARASAGVATGGSSELAIQAGNIASGKQKLSVKSLAKQAAVSGASMATGGQSDTALKALKTAKALKKGGVKGALKTGIKEGASYATGGKSDTALQTFSKVKSTASAVKKVASTGKKLVKKVTKEGKTIVTEVPENYVPQYNETYVSSYSPEDEFVETEVSEEGELVETKRTSPAAVAIAGGAAATLIGYLLLKGDN